MDNELNLPAGPSDSEEKAKVRVPRDWKESGVPPGGEYIPYQERTYDAREQEVAKERASVFDQVIERFNGMTVKRGMEVLGLGHSQFYNLLRRHRKEESIQRNKKGRVIGSCWASDAQIAALEEAYEKKFEGPKASLSKLHQWAREYFKGEGENVTRYRARQFLMSKPEREVYFKRYGKEKTDHKYGFKPHKFVIDGLLHRVSMDHTMVDILLVDEQNRNIIIGRPWVTMLICDKSRVILGFFLSLDPPNLDTVAAALAFAVMNKDFHLFRFLTNPNEYPFFGIPFVIFTDNAAEFTSEKFIEQCKAWGMDWEHRPIGKKWYGGIIERLIGTFMTTEVHFLPGATGSNVVQREDFNSEYNATMDYEQFAVWFLNQVTVYHGKIHSSLKCTPREAWNHYVSQGLYDHDRVIASNDQMRFLIDFSPTSFDHKVHPYGINFAGRRYACYELAPYVGQRFDIKYLRHDLSYVWVKLPGKFLKVPCSYNRVGLANTWDSYSNHKQLSKRKALLKDLPPGTVDDEFAHAALANQTVIVQEAVDLKTAFMANLPPKGLPAPQSTLIPATEAVTNEPVEDWLIEDTQDFIPTILTQDENAHDVFVPRIIREHSDQPDFLPVIIVDKHKD